MNIELTKKELELIQGLIARELEETRTEIRHSVNLDYKELLRTREDQLHHIVDRIRTESH